MINEILNWLEAHERLSGWAQFAGAMLTLWVMAGLAARDSRRHRHAAIHRTKALLRIAATTCRDVQAVMDQRTDGPQISRAANVRKTSLKSSLTDIGHISISELSSTFMINNRAALVSHINTMIETFETLGPDNIEKHFEYLEFTVIGLNAICSNLATEVRRLGGKLARHDDPNVKAHMQMPFIDQLATRVQAAYAAFTK